MMVEYLGPIGFAVCTVAFVALAILLLTSWKGGDEGLLLVVAVVATAVWAAIAGIHVQRHVPTASYVFASELARDGAWLVFLCRIISGSLRLTRWAGALMAVLFAAGVVALPMARLAPFIEPGWTAPQPLFVVMIAVAVAVLVLIEQIYGNADAGYRWRIKFLCGGLGTIFIYDVYLYSNALLLQSLDFALWETRGILSALVVPLILVSAARNKDWSLDVFVSRTFVFRSVTLLAVGAYLFIMASAGYMLKAQGSTWGISLNALFLAGASLVLVLLLTSGQLRARVKVFLSKHFFNYKYDYREEWLRLTDTIADSETSTHLSQRATICIAQILDSRGGVLLLKDEAGDYVPCEPWNIEDPLDTLSVTDGLVGFLNRTRWIVNIDEYRVNPRTYEQLHIPDWIREIADVWLILPLFHSDELVGILILIESRAPRALNWEDYDLLKTACCQVASDLAQEKAAVALANAKQFEAYNRVSAFIMHDLKNVIGQLSLVVDNGKRLRHNEAFVSDAFDTVENAVLRMKRLLSQLKHSRDMNLSSRVDIVDIVRRVVKERSLASPTPDLADPGEDYKVMGHPDKLTAVIGNVIQNAQDATPSEGSVRVSVVADISGVVVRVEDNGEGMTEQFVEEQLFKPFVSTKGDGGMGIGAYETKEYMETLGGSISVRSRIGEGTVINLRFPKVHTDTVEKVA